MPTTRKPQPQFIRTSEQKSHKHLSSAAFTYLVIISLMEKPNKTDEDREALSQLEVKAIPASISNELLKAGAIKYEEVEDGSEARITKLGIKWALQGASFGVNHQRLVSNMSRDARFSLLFQLIDAMMLDLGNQKITVLNTQGQPSKLNEGLRNKLQDLNSIVEYPD